MLYFILNHPIPLDAARCRSIPLDPARFHLLSLRYRWLTQRGNRKSLVFTFPIGYGLAGMKPLGQLIIEEKIEGPDRVLGFRGSADILSMPLIQEQLNRYRKDKIRLLLIDLSATEFINSPVWAVITLFARNKENSTRVAIIGMSQRIRGSFEMMGLNRELKTYESAEMARQDLGLPVEQ
jgi:anti-anti-sigma factor